jgi:hypothetical protein
MEVDNLVNFKVLMATSMKMAVLWDVAPYESGSCYLALRRCNSPDDGGIITSETSVNIYQTTWRYIPDDIHVRGQTMSTVVPVRY